MRPLPLRDGVDPTRLVVADEEHGHTLGEILTTRFPGHDDYLATQFDAAAVVTSAGEPVGPQHRPAARSALWLYRQLPVEADVPYDMPVLYRDDRLIVVDKPPFLATMPRGSRVVQSALVRLRRATGIDTLAPAHRLDRLTSGVLLFTTAPQYRAAYQELFAQRQVRKQYRALAAADPALVTPRTVLSRIEKTPGIMWAREVDGEPNAESVITLVSQHPDVHHDQGERPVGEYLLAPRTGKTHQLRLHMAGLGVPIIGDPLYGPHVDREAIVRGADAAAIDAGDFANPLRLLAEVLEFVDPVDGSARRFVSQQQFLLR